MIEFDVRLSLDGYPVVIHDGDVDRTTNGHGCVEEMKLADLLTLDAGAWFDPRFAGQRLPRLVDALEFARGRGTFLDIEMKFNKGSVYGLCDAVGALIEKHAFHAQCVVTSFDHGALNYLKQRFPRVEIARLYWTHAPRDRDLKSGVPSAAVFHMLVVPSLVKRVHRYGGKLHIYTVDDPNDMRRFVRMGVDTIMTNRPALLARVLEEVRTAQPATAEGEAQADKK